MENINRLREELGEQARDIKINVESLLGEETLTPAQKWGVAVTAALAARNPRFSAAVIADARAAVGDAVIDDAIAAAAVMAQNNVFYRFRHLVGKPEYADQRARLRMQRLGKPATSKTDFELFQLAVSLVNNCEWCVRAHEKVAREGGLSMEQIHDAVRLTSVIAGMALALEMPRA